MMKLMLFCTSNHLQKMMASESERKSRYGVMEKDMKEAAKLAGGASTAKKPAAKKSSKE